MREIIIAALTTIGIVVPVYLKIHANMKAATTPTYDKLSSQIVELWDRIDTQQTINATLNSRLTLLEDTNTKWQDGWNDLQARWPWWRLQTTPPPYPTPKYEKGELR